MGKSGFIFTPGGYIVPKNVDVDIVPGSQVIDNQVNLGSIITTYYAPSLR